MADSKELPKLILNPVKWLHWKRANRRYILSHEKMARVGRHAIEENQTFYNSLQDDPEDNEMVLASKRSERVKFQREQDMFIGYLISQMTSTTENTLSQDPAYKAAVEAGDAFEVWKAIRDVIYTRYRDPFEIGRMMDELQSIKQGDKEGLEPFVTRFNERAIGTARHLQRHI